MTREPGAFRRWWKSPRVRNVRRRVSDAQVWLFPPLGALARLWVWGTHRFIRFDRRGPLFERFRTGDPGILVSWHQDSVSTIFQLYRYTPRYPTLFMVSPGRIGQVAVYFFKFYGIECVQGSSARGGIAAVEELTHRAQTERVSVLMMADGSRGPARQAKWGAIYLARDTGLPLIPMRSWGTNLIVLKKTWMKLGLPLPWGRAVMLSGEPIYVPPDADKAVLEECRAELERRLNAMCDASEAYLREGPSAVEAWGEPIAEPTAS